MLSAICNAFLKAKIFFKFKTTDCDYVDHKVGSKVLDNIKLSDENTKIREDLIAMVSSSNICLNRSNKLFP